MPARRCTNPRCPNPAATGGKCATHRRRYDRERHANTPYHTPRWQRFRAKILRATPECAVCGARATDVDHVIAIADGGAIWDAHNCQALCATHHARKTRQDAQKRKSKVATERPTR